MGDEVGGILGGAAKGATSLVKGAGNLVGSAVRGAGNLVGDVAGAGGNLAHAVLNGVGDTAKSVGGAANHIMDGSTGITRQPIPGGASSIPSLLSQSTPAIADVAGGAVKSAGSFMPNLPDGEFKMEDFLHPVTKSPGVLDQALGIAGKYAVPAGLMAYQVHKNNQPVPGAENLRNMASKADGEASVLQAGGQAALEGHIPGQAQQIIDRSVEQQEAQIRQRYAGMGMSGSTAEQMDLNAIHQRGVEQTFAVSQQMAATGLNAAAARAGVSPAIYQYLLEDETKRGSDFGDALAGFAAAVAK